ncbi:MAG: acyltransferase, partial [Sphingomonadales bacterium]
MGLHRGGPYGHHLPSRQRRRPSKGSLLVHASTCRSGIAPALRLALSLEGQDRRSSFYRPEIDGLRAVAVLAVLLFHAHLGIFQGGFAGVDIFFVISGYLITGIVLRDGGGRFDTMRFYMNRARRILPALIAMLGISLLLALLLPRPAAVASFGGSLAAAALFVANIFFWQQGAGYFDQVASEMPLMHLWSLSVEEQFYLLFPPLLALSLRGSWKRAAWLIGVPLLLSFGLAELLSATRPAANYYLLPTRAWELLAGAAVALAEHRYGRVRMSAAWSDAGGAAGAV